METTKPRTVNSIGMFDMLKGAGMLASCWDTLRSFTHSSWRAACR